VIEFGCGDGGQLSLLRCPRYIGLDVSPSAIALCRDRFSADDTKSFFLYDPRSFVDKHGVLSADLSLSLDVIYHLTEDHLFDLYMTHLFGASTRFVVVYSSNREDQTRLAHVREREFTPWIETHARGWRMIQVVDSPYPFDPGQPDETSDAAFYVFGKIQS
jgi:cyclopropane fatty-acyl-phospholipid synthase-like methyltransferase